MPQNEQILRVDREWDHLEPAMRPDKAREDHIAIKASAAINEVQTETLTATGGTRTLTVQVGADRQTTGNIAYDANAATIQAALEALSNVEAGDIVVSGTGPFVYTFGGNLAGTDMGILTVDAALLTGGTSTMVETIKGAGEYVAYPMGQVVCQKDDGSNEFAKIGTSGYTGPARVLKRNIVVDSNGYHQYGTEWQSTVEHFEGSVPAYYDGYFKSQDLTGLDDNDDMNTYFNLIRGTRTAGIVKLQVSKVQPA